MVKKWATENNIEFGDDIASILDKPETHKAVIDNLLELAKINKFSGLEKIKKVHLTADPFTIENDLLTPTMKIKRNKAKDAFIDQINKMYEGL